MSSRQTSADRVGRLLPAALVCRLKGDPNTQYAYKVSLELLPVEVLEHRDLKRHLENPSQRYDAGAPGEMNSTCPPHPTHGVPITTGLVGPGAVQLENPV